jgi:hypothetical protein
MLNMVVAGNNLVVHDPIEVTHGWACTSTLQRLHVCAASRISAIKVNASLQIVEFEN